MSLSFFSFLFLIRIRLYEMQNRKRKETTKNKDREVLQIKATYNKHPLSQSHATGCRCESPRLYLLSQ